MCSLLMAQYLANIKATGVEIRPSSRLSRRFSSVAKRERERDATRISGAGSVRRMNAVRASASGDSRREQQQNGLECRRDEATRYQWQWHEDQGPVNSWSHSNPFDREIVTPSTSEVWDCYDSQQTPPSSGGNPGDASIEGSSSTSDANSNGRSITPEQEFLSYAMKYPQQQYNGIDLMNSRDSKLFNSSKEVYVLLFGVGEVATEGIYSLRSHSQETGLHHETIICFESSEDAARFSGLLEASMPHVSTVHTIISSELIQFCSNSGYDCRLELEGSTLMPPEFNVGITDWERSMKLRQGHFQVLEEEPEYANDPSHHEFSDNEEVEDQEDDDDFYPHHHHYHHPDSSRVIEEEEEDDISSQLDEVRAMLERLLPNDNNETPDQAE